MIIQAYLVETGVFTITLSTPRPDALASTKFVAGSIHDDYVARVRSLLKEHKHIGTTAQNFPAAKRLQNYLPIYPISTGKPLFALRELMPAGSQREVNGDFFQDETRIRYSFTLHRLPASFAADEIVAEGIERHMLYALRQLFSANDVPDSFIPGDDSLRPGDRTEIEMTCELGPSSGRGHAEIPTPA